MTALPFVHRHEPEAAVAALCRLTGLAPGAVAAILAEIADDDLPAYRKRLLADALPCIWGAYLAGGYAACAAPEVWPRLVRTCVANFCGFYGLAPSRLANSTAHRAANGNWADTPSPERVAAIFCELDEQMVASLRCQEEMLIAECDPLIWHDFFCIGGFDGDRRDDIVTFIRSTQQA